MALPSPASSPGARTGILWMLVTTLCFTGANVGAKYLAQSYHPIEVTWGRFIFQALLLVPFLPLLFRHVRTRRPGLHVARSACIIGSSFLLNVSLIWLPIADASALIFTAPLIIAALSVVVLGEPVSARRWVAVAVGFGGALVVVRPGLGIWQLAALLALGAALIFALVQITTRMMSTTEDALSAFVISSLVSGVLSTVGVPFIWTAPDAAGWAVMVAMGGVGAIGQYTLFLAFQRSEAAAVAPYNYAGLLWAAIFGYLIFSDVPDPWTIAGATLIVASGLYLFRAERSGRGAAARDASPSRSP